MPAVLGKPQKQTQCVVYLRTSSAANVGEEKDSEPRQREKCKAWTGRKGWKVVAEFRDPAVSGTDALVLRRGFADCVEYCLEHGVKYIIVESGDRFARNLVVQETALNRLQELDLEVICAENETQFSEPSAVERKNYVLCMCALTPQAIPTRSHPLHPLPAPPCVLHAGV